MKQVIVVNETLNLLRGKLAAQVAHAAVATFLAASPTAQQAWLAKGMPKVVLDSPGEAHLRQLAAVTKERAIPAYLVIDAGKTVVPAGTVTCLGLGPAEAAALDELMGELRLLR